MEGPKQNQKKIKNGKKTIERMEIIIFSAIWQKPPKTKENLENYKENKPLIIGLYVIIYSNSAGNLGNGRIKLDLNTMKL